MLVVVQSLKDDDAVLPTAYNEWQPAYGDGGVAYEESMLRGAQEHFGCDCQGTLRGDKVGKTMIMDGVLWECSCKRGPRGNADDGDDHEEGRQINVPRA